MTTDSSQQALGRKSFGSDSVFDDVVGPDDAASSAFDEVRTDWLPFLHWLNLRHADTGDELWDLAHLVLSGGPDGLWANRFDLTAVMVYEDVQLLYASGNASVTSQHVEQARRAKKVYYDTAPKVAELAHHRRRAEADQNRDVEHHDGSRTVGKALSSAFTERNLALGTTSQVVPQVTDADGDDVAVTESDVPQLRMSNRCTHILADGRRCANRPPVGNEVCTSHGGRVYTDDELRNIHRVTKEKLLGAGEQAVDTLISLFNSPNDMVRLKAAEAVLDRTGFVPGMEVTVVSSPDGDRTPAQIIADRLARLASEPPTVEQVDTPATSSDDEPPNVVDGEVVDTTTSTSEE